METPDIRFSISPWDGQYKIVDNQSKVQWNLNPFHARLGGITLNGAGQKPRLSLGRPEIRRVDSGLEPTFHPLLEPSPVWMRVLIRSLVIVPFRQTLVSLPIGGNLGIELVSGPIFPQGAIAVANLLERHPEVVMSEVVCGV